MSGLFGTPDTSAQERQLEEMRKQNDVEKKRIEEETRTKQEELASQRYARLRGGKRMLLAESRLNPETGVDTLGTTTTVG